MRVKDIGAGLAGCEAVWQLIKAGIEVELYAVSYTHLDVYKRQTNNCSSVLPSLTRFNIAFRHN